MTRRVLPLSDGDILSGAWARTRAGLVRAMWLARIGLEAPLSEDETLRLRERIRFIRELLAVDPRKNDYDIPTILENVGIFNESETGGYIAHPSFPDVMVGDSSL